MARGDKFVGVIMFTWVFGVFATVAFWAAVVYVAYHFISKVW